MEQHRTLEELAREARLEYYRAYRAKHRDRIKKNNSEYWKRRALKLQAEKGAMTTHDTSIDATAR